MKIGVTGYSGHVGREVMKYPDMVGLECDVTKAEHIGSEIRASKVDVVLHLASVSNVDVCEKIENEKWIFDVNVRGTSNVANVCDQIGIPMVLLSTAHIFSGRSWTSYREHDTPYPCNQYGFTKLEAEALRIVYPRMKIVRTSYLFDDERLMYYIDIHQKGNYQEYPTFMVRSFMYLPHLVRSLNEYLRKISRMPEILHISGSKSASWYDYMKYAVTEFGMSNECVLPRKSEKPNMVPRPHRASLNVHLSEKVGLPQYSYMDGIREIASYV